MHVDKALLLKGVAGVAALGGVVGGGFAAKSAGLFSSFSKTAGAGEGNLEDATDNQQSTLQSSNDQATGALTQDSPKSTEDSQGIPNRCNTSTPCELTEEELKKIKFEVLGDDETTAVTVEGFPTGDQKLTLTIDSTDTAKKKYIFSNGSSNPVKIKRGTDESKIVTLDNTKKTKFSLSDGKLKQFTLNDYGLPSDCTESCTLTSTDLEDVKFEGLGTEAGTVTVTPKQKVTLTIGTTPKRYKFNNTGSQITITKGSGNTAKTVTLNTGVTEYKENSGVLRYVEPTDVYGIPTRCNTSSPCDLSEENLKNIKFEGLEGEESTAVTVDNFPSAADQKITLTIDSTDSTKKKYIFSNGSSNDVKIKRGDDKAVTLKGSGRTKFTVENNKLKQFDLGDYGLPSGCTQSCSLTYTDLEDIKFDGLEGTLTIEPKNQKVSLTIDSSSSDHKRYLFTSSSSVTINGSSGSSGPITLDSSKTRFKGNSGKLKKIVLDDKGIPTDCINNTCTLTADDLKLVKFPGFDTATGTVTVSPNNQTVSLTINSGKKEYSFNNGSSSAITVTKGSASVELAKEGPTVFYEEEGKLVKTTAIDRLNEMLKAAGFPEEKTCKFEEGNISAGIECKLDKSKFTKLKFNNLGDDGMNEEQITISNSITAKIEKDGTGVKITFSGVNSISVDKKTPSNETIYVNSNSVFFINSQNKIEKKKSK